LSFVDATSADRMYGYYVVSVDIAGHESAPSETVYTGDPFPLPFEEGEGDPVEPLPGEEGLAPPLAPGAPSAQARDLGIRLEWTPNAASDRVDEYRIYYAPEEAGPYNQIGVSGRAEFEFLSLTTAGWYRITAANTAGESPPSPAVQFKP
jgi:penicillin-binding protein